MRRGIHVRIGAAIATGELHDSPTANRMWEALRFTAGSTPLR